MSDRQIPPLAAPSGSIDPDSARPAAENSRKVLEELAQEFVALWGERRQMDPHAFAILMDCWLGAAERHMRIVGIPESRIQAALSAHAELTSAAYGARRELLTLMAQFERGEAENPDAAKAFVKRFAQLGAFILSAQGATHDAPGSMQ